MRINIMLVNIKLVKGIGLWLVQSTWYNKSRLIHVFCRCFNDMDMHPGADKSEGRIVCELNCKDDQGQQVSMKFVYSVSIVAALGGLLFGFDTAVVSGAIGFMKERFDLNEVEVGWAVSSLIIGCIVGLQEPVCLATGSVGKKC